MRIPRQLLSTINFPPTAVSGLSGRGAAALRATGAKRAEVADLHAVQKFDQAGGEAIADRMIGCHGNAPALLLTADARTSVCQRALEIGARIDRQTPKDGRWSLIEETTTSGVGIARPVNKRVDPRRCGVPG